MATRGAAGRGSRFTRDSRIQITSTPSGNMDADRARISPDSPIPPVAVETQNPEDNYADFNPPPDMDLDNHLPEDYDTGVDEGEDTTAKATGYPNIPEPPDNFDNLMDYFMFYFQGFTKMDLPHLVFHFYYQLR